MSTQNPAHELKLLKSSVAMTVTLISFGMLFASLFLGYFLVRFNAPVWPPVEIQGMPVALPLLSTLVMLLSSVTYFKFEKSDSQRKLYWTLTVFLGLLFLVLQGSLWMALKNSGILIANGIAPSMVYAFSWLHAGHIVLGLGAVLWLGFYLFKKPQGLTEIKLINVGKFWHFLGVIWLLMYLMMFVL